MTVPPAIASAVAFSGLLLIAMAWWVLRRRNMQIWIGSYVKEALQARAETKPPITHVYFCFADHFEPYWNRADQATARQRVRRWTERYPVIAGRHRDSDGRSPRHSFFYPEEEYDPEILDGLARLCRDGYGDVEVHLHHDNDTADNLRETLERFKTTLYEKHGLLRRNPETEQVEYCFIHGNWALDNSRPDGRWCGVPNELSVLVETGCRVDMTMPSAPSDTQTSKINSIYFARGRAGCSKSHNSGRDAVVGEWGSPDELLLVQGPLALNWKNRKFGLVPKIDSGEVSFDAPSTGQRVRLWGERSIGVRGAPGHVFIKVHTHGTEGRTSGMLLEGGLDTLWTELEAQYRDSPGHALHYVSAWEMYTKVRELCRKPAGASVAKG